MGKDWLEGWASRRLLTFRRDRIDPYTERYPVRVTIKAGEAELLRDGWWSLEFFQADALRPVWIYHCSLFEDAHIPCNGRCNPDFSDIRFTAPDGITLISQWIEGMSGEGLDKIATAWVGIDYRGQKETTAYMYHNNPDAEPIGAYGDLEGFGLYGVAELKKEAE